MLARLDLLARVEVPCRQGGTEIGHFVARGWSIRSRREDDWLEDLLIPVLRRWAIFRLILPRVEIQAPQHLGAEIGRHRGGLAVPHVSHPLRV